MNDVRTRQYDDFAKIGLEKEKTRTDQEGDKKSGSSVYKSINDEMKILKERLRSAGVNRIVAGIDANEEEEYYDEEEDNEAQPDDPVAKAQKQMEEEGHVPKIAGGISATPQQQTTKTPGGGIPRPSVKDNFIKQSIDKPADIPAMRNSGRDFRIHANSSKTSFMSGTESNSAKPIPNRLPKQRPHLIGANKPHMIKNQND